MNFNPALNTIAYVLIILSIAFIIIQYSQSNVTIDSVDAIKDKMKGIYDYMPKSKTEFKWFIVLSISAGVCGEIIFRFFLFEFLVINTNIIVAFVLTNKVFGITHIGSGKQTIVLLY